MAYPLHQDEDDDGSGYRLRESYSSISGSGHVAASDTGLIPLVAARPQHTLFIQRIHVDVTTGGASATWTFQDGAGVPILPAVVASAVTMVDLDFGAIGVPCTEGTAFVLTIPTAGAIGWLTWEGYRKLTGVETLPSSTPPHYRDLVIADGASNYWRLNEPSGLVATDLVGGANGTISGGVTLNQPGALATGGTAMAFDGTTGKIVTPATLNLPGVLSIELWFRIGSNSAAWCAFTTTSPSAAGTDALASFAVNATAGNSTNFNGYIKYAAGDEGGFAFNFLPFVCDGSWHHLVWVFPGGTVVRLYLDGVVQPGAPTLLHPLTGIVGRALEIGHSTDFTQWWNGSLDEVAIYPVALTPAQIAAHYAVGLGRAVPV